MRRDFPLYKVSFKVKLKGWRNVCARIQLQWINLYHSWDEWSISGRSRIDSMRWQTRCILCACDVSPSASLELHEDAWHRLLRIDRLKCLRETGESDYYAILFATCSRTSISESLINSKERFFPNKIKKKRNRSYGFLKHRVYKVTIISSTKFPLQKITSNEKRASTN